MTTVEPEYIVTLVIAGLAVVAWYMIRDWKQTVTTRLVAQDRRLDGHDEKHAQHDTAHKVLQTKLDNIEKTADETSADVKTLLRQSYANNRHSGG